MTAALNERAVKFREMVLERRGFDPVELDSWIEQVALTSGESAIPFHLSRLLGVGGADAGVLVMNHNGENNFFGNWDKLYFDKILANLPELPNGYARRGIALEPIIRREIISSIPGAESVKSDANDAIDEALDAQLLRAGMIGHIDDLLEIDGKFYLYDYKSVSDSVDMAAWSINPPINYVAQLHHYRDLLEQVGIEIEGMRLGVLVHSDWSVHHVDVPFDPELDHSRRELTEWFWNHVEMQKMPPLPDELITKTPERIILKRESDQAVVDRFVALKQLEKEVGSRVKEFRRSVDNILSRYSINPDTAVVLGDYLKMSKNRMTVVNTPTVKGLSDVASRHIEEWEAVSSGAFNDDRKARLEMIEKLSAQNPSVLDKESLQSEPTTSKEDEPQLGI
jgi:hypothetical protein